jgi:hypothetical protein
VFNQKSSEKPIIKSNNLKLQIEEMLDDVAQYVIIDENLINILFSLLINPKNSNVFSFLIAADKEVVACKFQYSHPMLSQDLKPGNQQKLHDLHRLFYLDESIHSKYDIDSNYKEFVQWVFFNYLSTEYNVKLSNKIPLDQPRIIHVDQKPEIKNQPITEHFPEFQIISDDEMAS